MADFQLNAPVAFIIFNRPEFTARVFDEIARARPRKLLVIGDGPRLGRVGEAETVRRTRQIVQRVNWPCDVLTNFSAANLGCRRRVSSGIDWVFQQVDEAIILEDDCLPEQSFFQYCQELLARYRSDQRIGMISGDNFQLGRRDRSDSYYFSKYSHIWGWASWRNRWQGSYDEALSEWPNIRRGGRLAAVLNDEGELDYWESIFQRVHTGDIDTWDYQWVLANFLAGRLSIMPSVNLISNIGFGPDATHTSGVSPLANLPVEPMRFPMVHPVEISRNQLADRYIDRMWVRPPLWRRLQSGLATKIRKLIG